MNISAKWLMVWKVEEKNGFTKLDLGDSKKNKDGSYDNFTWYNCTLLGKAKDVRVCERDKVEIKSGIITKRKYNEKWYDDIIIFDIEVMEGAKKRTPEQTNQEFNKIIRDELSDIPF